MEDRSVTTSLSDLQLHSLLLDDTYIENEFERADVNVEEKRDEPASFDNMSDGEYAKGMIYRSSHYSTSRSSTNRGSHHRKSKQQHMGANRLQRLQRSIIT